MEWSQWSEGERERRRAQENREERRIVPRSCGLALDSLKSDCRTMRLVICVPEVITA